MVVPEIFQTVESTSLSTWLRESDSFFGFYFVLLFHTFGLALLVGGNAVIDLRILGVAPDIALKPLKRLYGIMWTGFAINAATGSLLLYAYPTKALTNFVFYIKLSLIALGLTTMQRIKRRVFDEAGLDDAAMMATGKTMAIFSLVCWIGTITAGRLLAYTYTYIAYGHRG
jgi:hypothetical protein